MTIIFTLPGENEKIIIFLTIIVSQNSLLFPILIVKNEQI